MLLLPYILQSSVVPKAFVRSLYFCSRQINGRPNVANVSMASPPGVFVSSAKVRRLGAVVFLHLALTPLGKRELPPEKLSPGFRLLLQKGEMLPCPFLYFPVMLLSPFFSR